MFGSKKQLAMFLSRLRGFERPDLALEQYPSDSEVAAGMLWDAYLQGDIEDRDVADLGCGTGILGIGALALGAKHMVFVEIDPRVFPALIANLAALEEHAGEPVSNYEIVEGNISAFSRRVDVVIQNPPFGTRQEHADTEFLSKALEMAPVAYSMHKTSTLPYLREWALRHNARITAEQHHAFPLKQTMAQHSRRIVRIEVSSLRIERA